MIRVIERAGRILDAFTLDQSGRTLTECAQAADLNKSSAHRLLVSLEAIGLVERRDHSWRLGPRVVTMASTRLGFVDLRHEALPYLRELRREFRSAVAFSIPEGSDMIYLERLDSPETLGVSARLGAMARMWAGGSGKAVLAAMDDAERKLRLDLDEWRRLPKAVRQRVLAEIELAEERGYCIDNGEFFNGIGGVAVALRDANGDPAAALSVIVSNEQLTDAYARVLAARLRVAADSLELFLGRESSPTTGARLMESS